MPYNFNATFTQPIILKLDNGTLSGAKDWADTITKGYITTIKAGLPQGVPSTLPAPGLNPLAPPPFPIGASGFSTAESRQKAMYTVLYAYFYAKEVSLEKASIENLAKDVVQLTKVIKQKTKQLKTLIETVKLVAKQLLELPKIITEIIQGIKDEIKARIQDLKEIDVDLSKFKAQLSPADFNDAFKDELNLLEKIKSFNPLDIAGIREIALFVSEYGKRTNTILAAVNNESLMKKYMRDKMLGVAKVFLELAKGVTDPTKILDFVSQLNKDSERVKNLFKRVQQFDLFVRFLQPKLRKLEIKKNILIAQLRNKIQVKLVEVRKKLDERIAKYISKKKEGKAAALYSKAAKLISNVKTRVVKQVKIYKRKLTLLRKAFKIAVTIVGKVTSLITGLRLEFDKIKKEILEQQKKLEDIRNGFKDLPKPAFTLPSTTIDKLSSDTPEQLLKEINKLEQYFHTLGLGEFANLGVLAMTQTKCNFLQFKQLFERKRSTVQQYAEEAIGIQDDVDKLINILKEFKTGVVTPSKPKDGPPSWLFSRIQSVSQLLHLITAKIKPKVDRVKAWIKKQIDNLKLFIETKLAKYTEDLKIYAINLIPLKSNVQDPKNKKMAADAKIKIIKDKVAKIKNLLLLATYIAKMLKGAVKLASNLSKGVYKFSENQNPIDQMLDGLYSFMGNRQSSAVLAGQLAEKQRIKSHFKSLIIIEALTYGLIETFKDMKDSKFPQELEEAIKTMNPGIPGIQTIKSFQNLVQNPPKTPKEFTDAANLFAMGILYDANISTKIVALEVKHLKKSREIIKTLFDIPELENTSFIKLMTKVKTVLDKNQSFILLAFDLLKEQVDKLIAFIKRKVNAFIDKQKAILKIKRAKIEEDAKLRLKTEIDRKVNVDAAIMSFTFGLAARMFWTGANWTGPTGTNHIALSIGPFKPVKFKTTDGASVTMKEIASSFEKQLQTMTGLIIPPPNTGIPPFPFSGYK